MLTYSNALKTFINGTAYSGFTMTVEQFEIFVDGIREEFPDSIHFDLHTMGNATEVLCLDGGSDRVATVINYLAKKGVTSQPDYVTTSELKTYVFYGLVAELSE